MVNNVLSGLPKGGVLVLDDGTHKPINQMYPELIIQAGRGTGRIFLPVCRQDAADACQGKAYAEYNPGHLS